MSSFDIASDQARPLEERISAIERLAELGGLGFLIYVGAMALRDDEPEAIRYAAGQAIARIVSSPLEWTDFDLSLFSDPVVRGFYDEYAL